MSHLIDTNICSASLKGAARIQNKFMQDGGACRFLSSRLPS